MSLTINPSLLEKKIFTPTLPSDAGQSRGYTDEGIFVIGKADISAGQQGVILESSNATQWNQINYPGNLGGVLTFGSNSIGDIIVKLGNNAYFLSDIKSGSTSTPLWTGSNSIYNRVGYYSYIESSVGDGVINYKQSALSPMQSFTLPYAAASSVSKSFYTIVNTVYYTGNNWWDNFGTKNLLEIPGFINLNSGIFEAKDTTGNVQTRNLAFAFANNFTKILKISPSSTSINPSFELIDCITPIPVFTGLVVKAIISNDGMIWANWFNPDNQTMVRIFSPNLGGQWFSLSTIQDYSFSSSSNGRNQVFSSVGRNPLISINYGR